MQPVAVFALALSDVQVHSFLNQPLEAHVRLTPASQVELESLEVKVEAAGTGSHVTVVPEIRKDDQGSYIRLTTKDPVREPVLKLQLKANWFGGALSREYALIIDPR